MEKNIFILLICVLLAISNSQIPEKNSNLKSLRRLEESNETILLGFDGYTYDYNSTEKKFNLTFNTYFLLKNWNLSEIKDEPDYFNFESIKINSYVFNDTKNKEPVTFKCDYNYTFDNNNNNYYHITNLIFPSCKTKNSPYCLVRFICQGNSTFYPKKINIDDDFENKILLNQSIVTYESTSAKAIKKDLTSLNKFNPDYNVLTNTSFIKKDANSFKIKGDFYDKGFEERSNYIELITLVNGYPKKIPCIGSFGSEDPEDEDRFYFIETKEKSALSNAELKYALVNFTKANKVGIIDFQEGENSTFFENTYVPKKKKGLSTGAIIGIIIPSCIVLLGVSALVFLLSRKPLPAQQIKNIGNNTIGVASSEAVVHQ